MRNCLRYWLVLALCCVVVFASHIVYTPFFVLYSWTDAYFNYPHQFAELGVQWYNWVINLAWLLAVPYVITLWMKTGDWLRSRALSLIDGGAVAKFFLVGPIDFIRYFLLFTLLFAILGSSFLVFGDIREGMVLTLVFSIIELVTFRMRSRSDKPVTTETK